MSEPAPSPTLLADVYQAASECNKCSLCQAVCPTYSVNPVEWETARGRVSLVRDVIEGHLELRDIAEGPLSTCLACDNCVAACPPAVPTAQIVSRARQELHASEGLPLRLRINLRAILPHRGAIAAIHRLTRVADMLGMGTLVRRPGLTGWMGASGSAPGRAGRLPRRTAHQLVRHLPAPTPPLRGRLAFLVCCTQNVVAPEATAATMRVLLANGFELTTPRLSCCGQPAQALGDRDALIDMAAATVEALGDVTADALVGDVAACAEHVRAYGEVLAGDRLHEEGARRIGAWMEPASLLLARRGIRAPLGPLHWTVAIDEPCSYAHGSPERAASLTLLEAIPSLRILPLTEAAMCCGGLNGYYNREPERSDAILRRKFDNVISSKAHVLVTEDVSCLTQLRAGARRYAPHVRVMHTFEVLDAAIESGRQRRAVTARD